MKQGCSLYKKGYQDGKPEERSDREIIGRLENKYG
jgi:hypothetical protein